MLLPSSTWTPLGLLILGVKGSFGEGMWFNLSCAFSWRSN